MIKVEKVDDGCLCEVNGTIVEIFTEAAVLIDDLAEKFQSIPMYGLKSHREAVEFVITGIYESIINVEKGKNRP